MYHDIVEPDAPDASGFPGADAALYKLERAHFARHLRAVADALAQAPRRVFELNADARARPLLLTFDDGGVSAYTHVAPLLEELGWRGHFFVTTDYIDTPTFLSRAQIRELDARGHVIGSHSCTHPLRMAQCDAARLCEEWRRSVATLAEITGAPVRVASVPGGQYARRVAEAAALAGIEFLFTSEPVAKSRSVGACRILGRYSIQRWTTPETAAALAEGRVAPRARQLLLWNAKKLLKTLGGEQYLRARRALVGHG